MDLMVELLLKMPVGEKIVLDFDDGATVLAGEIDTCYDDDNGLDVTDENYEVFYVCLFRINEVVRSLNEQSYKVNQFIELSIHNHPDRIRSENGDIIWKNTKKTI